MRTLRITFNLSNLGLEWRRQNMYQCTQIPFYFSQHSSTRSLPVAPWPAGHPTVPPAVYFKHQCNTQHFAVWVVPWNSSIIFSSCQCKITEMLTTDCLSCLLPNNCLTRKFTPILGHSGCYIIHRSILGPNVFLIFKNKAWRNNIFNLKYCVKLPQLLWCTSFSILILLTTESPGLTRLEFPSHWLLAVYKGPVDLMWKAQLHEDQFNTGKKI